jgi:sugar/nucleoside kinase (ribokinase family)
VARCGVHVLSEPGLGGTTGSVIVLTTPDAQRTMLSCWGTSARLPYDAALDDAVAAADVLVVEGYLWEMPETIASIKRALVTAKSHGVTVAFTCSDRTCVERHGAAFWELLRSGAVDVLFCNRDEALAMTGQGEHAGLKGGAGSDTMRALAACAATVIITDGSQGAYLRHGDEQVRRTHA